MSDDPKVEESTTTETTTTEEHTHTFPAVDTDAGHETPRGEPGPDGIYGLEVEGEGEAKSAESTDDDES